ncbi:MULTISPECIES: nucleotide sugar dehydrogenase [unclassified Streptomyces]|uniref:nucleotide sugar dehydrogenase n=1 Tax=unclassified Streptomyces TaxID=2593676 RepID=UPI001EDAB256|nr:MULTISPECIES: nucleotide sugar dehydrogenase [unclassified Streptomyces]UKL01478.1 nucleotide sugar dehydrogenase [Streptomyces sp. NBU3104]
MIENRQFQQFRVVVVGQGYVGLPLAVRAAEVGHKVVGFDVDAQRVKRLVLGESYVEDIPHARLAPLLSTGAYRPTLDSSDCADFDVAIVTVPTPLRDGVPDLSHVEDAARMLGRHLGRGATVVLESTTYPGTTEEVFGPLLEHASGLTAGHDFHIGYSPERIDPGNSTWKLENTPKVISGIDPASKEAVRRFYGSLVDTVVPVASCKEAELTKLLENTFRHVNVALANELAIFAHELDIDVWSAINAASTKPFGFMRFAPGPGVGGHCLPIDPSYLSWRVQRTLGRNFRFVELANDVNNHMPDYVVRRLVEGLNKRRKSLNGSRILLLGLAYKANTGDARETPAARIAELLTDMGAEVQAADPHVTDDAHPRAAGLENLQRVQVTPDGLAAADAVVLLAEHDAFDYPLISAHAPYILDCRHRLAGAHVESL